MKLINGNIEENLRFQIIEVQSQLKKTATYISNPSHDLLDSILSRDDYIDNLKTTIQRKCFALATDKANASKSDNLKAINAVASSLERIADFCEKIVRQITYIEEYDVFKSYDFSQLFAEITTGLSLVHKAVINGDVKMAISICKIEKNIDKLYAEIFNRILQELKLGKHTQSLVTTIFIARYLERMGDSLLNIGESIISAFLGDRIKIEQLEVLEKSLIDADLNPKISDLSLEAMGETKSGCRIDLVSSRNENDTATMMIFKEGHPEKLKKEKIGVDFWDALMPGIVPSIYGHHQQGDSGALLFEYLNGDTFEKILLTGTDDEFSKAQYALKQTLSSVWLKTRREEQKPAHFIRQIRDRIENVYTVHPDFSSKDVVFGEMTIPSFRSLLDEAEDIEKALASPFSVLTHGDFNIDNIIYDDQTGKIRFIDMHRSCIGDYVQDISVFMVSNFRLQVFDSRVRRRINQTIGSFYIFSAQAAKEVGDKTFNIRLALGLARSLATSTRFVLDKDVACDMLLRSRYLLEAVVRAKPGHYARFKLPEDAIIA
ncbi:MAG: PhoU domain-containing protein [Gammaproteobacteria bacterium]|nr:PhoU domain-containing protein [Gammaproteobacteria bacterium]